MAHSAPLSYLIEHGETRLDRMGETHGGRDEPLDRRGRAQAIALGQRLKRMAASARPSALYHSDRKRTRQTAQLAGHVAGIPVRPAPALGALKAGALGRGPQDRVAERLMPYARSPQTKIPGGESVAAWRARHLSFMERAARQAQRRGEAPPAFVAHSNVIGSVLGGAHGAIAAMADSPPPAMLLVASLPKGDRSLKP